MAAKRFSIDNHGNIQKQDYDLAKWFKLYQFEVSDIYTLSGHLSELESDRRKFVIRGEPLPHINLCEAVRRRASFDPEDDRAPYFRMAETGVQWFCIDIDSLPLSRNLKYRAKGVRTVKYAIQQLPECFRHATCHYQFSASYRVTDLENIRLHLWFWLDRPITDTDAKRWALSISADYTPIDISLYQPVQPHYTAAPIFENGIEDPLDQRSGLLEGRTEEVTVPHIPKSQRIARAGSSSTRCVGGSFDYWLSRVGDHEGGLGFHEPLLHAAWYYVLEHGSDIDVEALVDVLWHAIMDADQSGHSAAEIDNRASDVHLYGLVESAVVKLLHQEPCRLIEGVTPRYPAPCHTE